MPPEIKSMQEVWVAVGYVSSNPYSSFILSKFLACFIGAVVHKAFTSCKREKANYVLGNTSTKQFQFQQLSPSADNWSSILSLLEPRDLQVKSVLDGKWGVG